MIKKVSATGTYAGKKLTLETGQMARQANGAVVVRYGDTIVLVTACGDKKTKEGQDFFPLTVDFQEKFYSKGGFPGGFFKRETKPSDAATLTARLIDRPIRPLFPEGFMNNVHVVATVLSYDEECDPAVAATIGASASLMISDIPYEHPVAGVQISIVNGQLKMNPSLAELKDATLEIFLTATKDAIMMVEGACSEIPEAAVTDALMAGWDAIKNEGLKIQAEFVAKVQAELGKKEKFSFTPSVIPNSIKDKVKELATDSVRKGLSITNKQERYSFFDQDKKRVLEYCKGNKDKYEGEDAQVEKWFSNAYEDLKYSSMRHQVLFDRKRIDGRGLTNIRPIVGEVDLLPNAHGSALFTRGETQSLGVVTLGSADDAQSIDTLQDKSEKTFMLHYNFPPFSVGETGFLRGPGRREIGHGFLAERALKGVLPSSAQFPYTIRVVSEILESNGSSSMASVCSGSMALMSTGVPIKSPCAGIAMGLVKEGNDVAILSDILGDEDHLGDMDFKVAGTEKGITAIQMDIKIQGIDRSIVENAMKQAHQGRLHILGEMAKTISTTTTEMKENIPRIVSIKIKQDKIGGLIGPGGKNIKGIIEKTGAKINVNDEGEVSIASSNKKSLDEAVQMVRGLVTDPEIGLVYRGKVKKIVEFGAFVEILPGVEGLLHISEISKDRVQNVFDHLAEGEFVEVKLLEVDRMGKMKLSMKAIQK